MAFHQFLKFVSLRFLNTVNVCNRGSEKAGSISLFRQLFKVTCSLFLHISSENSKSQIKKDIEINIEGSDVEENGASVQAPLIDSTDLIKGQPKEVIKSVQLFQGKGPKGQIHVWWLFDDGGKTPIRTCSIEERRQLRCVVYHQVNLL